MISRYDYTLDGVGNRTGCDITEPLVPGFAPLSVDYTYNPGNILASADGITYDHDNNGNLIEKVNGGITTYAYDSLNRLAEVTTPGQNYEYIYNGLGHRVAKIVNGVKTNYLVDPNGILPQLLAEIDENNSLIAFYVYDRVGLVA